MLFRRLLLCSIVLALAAEPAYSQTWLQRYLRERHAKEEAKKTAADKTQDSPDNGEEIRQAEPVNPADPTLSPSSDSSDSGTPTAPDGSALPIRKAEPVNPEAPVTETAEPIRVAGSASVMVVPMVRPCCGSLKKAA